MFTPFEDEFPAGAHLPPHPPVRPPERSGKPDRPKLGARGERIVLLIVCFNLLTLFFAPIAGGTLFDWWAALTTPPQPSTAPSVAPVSRSSRPVP